MLCCVRLREANTEEGGQAMAKNGYAGRIKNTGTQVVKAPFNQGGKRGKSVVKTGDDLRTGKGGK